jgi:hypothetical protein
LCNLYSATKGQQAIREFTGAMHDRMGNLPPLYGMPRSVGSLHGDARRNLSQAFLDGRRDAGDDSYDA